MSILAFYQSYCNRCGKGRPSATGEGLTAIKSQEHSTN